MSVPLCVIMLPCLTCLFFPSTSILQVCDDYDVQQREFYFDRNPGLFPYVLHFYQTGKLHVMEELCVFSFRSDVHQLLASHKHTHTHTDEISAYINGL